MKFGLSDIVLLVAMLCAAGVALLAYNDELQKAIYVAALGIGLSAGAHFVADRTP